MKKYLLLAGILIMTGAGCANNTPPAATNTNQTPTSTEQPATLPPTAAAHSEMSMDAVKAGSSVIVKRAVFGQPGFIAIHTETNGQPGAIIGQSGWYATGTYTNISIRATVQAKTVYYAMMHTDNGNKTFSAKDDPTTKDEQGREVVVRFQTEATTNTTTQTPPTKTTGQTVSVTIVNYAYTPYMIRARKGDKIFFVNRDTVNHTVTADNGAFSSGTLANGKSFTIDTTRLAAGTYTFHCTLHPNMQGSITVE